MDDDMRHLFMLILSTHIYM